MPPGGSTPSGDTGDAVAPGDAVPPADAGPPADAVPAGATAAGDLPFAPTVHGAEAGGPDPMPGGLRRAGVGFAVGMVIYLLLLGIAATQRDPNGYWLLTLFLGVVAVAVVLLVAGLVMVAFPRTRMFAVGLLISVAVGVLVDGGVCIVLGRTA
jgi:hypothetical protein